MAACLLVTPETVGEQVVEVEEIIVDIPEPVEPVPQLIIDGDTIYTDNLAGLSQAIADRFGGADYSVMLYNLYGDSVLEIAADRQFTAASTYKLLVAYMMLLDAENGVALPSCFDNMIIYSDNGCPLAYLDRKSYSRANAVVQNLGLASTVLAYDVRTTARDLADFLMMIYNGSILSPASNERLLDTMTRQVFRNGIPAGVGDSGIVADKVGFLDGYLNDAAIVYRDSGDYILVILTNGSSWRAIADVTALIDARI
ncbi:hypothetical protein FACS189431_1310 [Alphaproteobacteria bacterium]|nr:hypothetical protein FACS189431_1310 [Alphaproteobacteria bacterium]